MRGAAATDPDPDHNRVVISLAGQRGDLLDALFSSAQAAIERIDLREHRGVHPLEVPDLFAALAEPDEGPDPPRSRPAAGSSPAKSWRSP